ncbi:MAG: peptidylprolyl isomerase [Bacteroidaceae bacterium]|nr:peptidylprolyl isomerase [Bacteroidaceae bacterium]
MRYLKTFLLSTCLFMNLGLHTVSAQDNVIDEVVWVVGDEAILKSEVEAERINAQYTGTRFEGDPYCVIPEELALQKLFLHQAAIDSVDVSESDVSRSVEMRINQLISQIGSKEKMEEYYNQSTTKIREELREKARDALIVQQMQQRIMQDVKVTPAEVRRYFKNLSPDSIPYIPTQVEVQILTLEPRIPEEETERIKAHLREFTKRINSGEMQFSTLALLYSEDKGSAVRGGETGFMGRGTMVTEYANVAFNLTDPSKVSKIVETEFGFHIIQLIEKRGDRVNTRHILLKPQVAEADLMAALSRLDSISNEIRSEKISFEKAATSFSSDKETRMNKGLMPNPMTRTSKFEMQDLPQEVARAVDRLEIGEISRPFTMIDTKGKEICAIVKLKSRVKGHKATLTEDFLAIKDIVLEKKQMEKLDNWIREKQKTTYIRINEKWKNCDFKYPGWIH